MYSNTATHKTTSQPNSGSPRIVVIGSLNTDFVFSIDHHPKEGETRLGKSFERLNGGKGANQAVAAARFGAQVEMVGRVGDDPFGEEQLASLQAEGIDVSGVVIDPSTSTGVASITVDDAGNNRIIIVPGANGRCGTEDIDNARAAIASADILLLQLEIPIESVVRAIEVAGEVGTKVILNPAPASPIDRGALSGVAVLTPNEVEAGQLTGVTVQSPDDAKVAAERLLALGVGAVAMTLGAEGVLVMSGSDEPTLVPAHVVEAVDTVGAGDTFNGVLAVGLAEGATLVEAARTANAAAALNVTRRGAQLAMPHRDEVTTFLAGAS